MNDPKLTERLLYQIKRHRQFQSGFDKHDDDKVNGELLTAAIEYMNLSKRQYNTRDLEVVRQFSKGTRPYVPVGGASHGYKVTQEDAKPPPHWPLADNMWAPSDPRYNLVRAATLIVAELERLDRQDHGLLGTTRKQARADRIKEHKRQADYYENVDTGPVSPLPYVGGNDILGVSSTGTLTVNSTYADNIATKQISAFF